MPKEKSITELRDERNQLATRSKEITAGARRETRMLNEGEPKELGEIQCRLADINTEIAMHEEENRGKGKLHQPQVGKFSLRRAIANLVDGTPQSDVEARVIETTTTLHNTSGAQMSEKRSIVVPVNIEKRAPFTATTEAVTGVIVDEEQQEMLLPLQLSLIHI